jgi:hypothetical protein
MHKRGIVGQLRRGRLVAGIALLGSTIGWQGVLTADTILESTLRSDFNDIAPIPAGCGGPAASIALSSSNGLTVDATDATGGIGINQQSPSGCPGLGWNGNFAPAEYLIWTGDNAGFNWGVGPITVAFSRPVSGVGTQFQTDGFGNFTARIQIYDGATLLDGFTENGDSTSAADGSAIFLGAIDSTGANITSAQLSLSVANPGGRIGDFAVNRISLLDGAQPSAPEPGTLALASICLLALGSAWPRRRV